MISGAVGNFANLDPKIEAAVCKKLGLKPAEVSTQVIQRDRHAAYINALALLGSSLEKFATEVRNLQRTEIGEMAEGFTKGQKGSSAMPHKKNPITAERITGIARMLRGYAVSAMENITDRFNSTTAALDEIQDTFSGLDIDLQYFSESQSYTSLVNLFTLALQYLISQFFNLKVEKRFTLKVPRSPIKLTIDEYGEFGDNDFYYNLFLKSNKLSGNHIVLLPAGFEVVVYG